MKVRQIVFTLIAILILSTVVLAGYTTFQDNKLTKMEDMVEVQNKRIIELNKHLEDTKWVCVTETCEEMVYGEDWIDHFCKMESGEVICEIKINDQEQQIPLEQLKEQTNISNLGGCKSYKCSAGVLAKNNPEEVK